MIVFVRFCYKIIRSAFIIIGCIYSGDIIAQKIGKNLKVDIITEFIIGDDPSKPIEYSLGRPWSVATDSSLNIYIADQGSMTVRVFNKKGNYIREIGQRGRGPGEFMSMRAIYINSKGELLIVDGLGFRIIKFSLEGEVIDTYSMSKETQDVVFFNQFTQTDNNLYLVLYKKFGSVGDEDEILHLWSSKFDNEIQAFGSFKEIAYKENFANEFAKAGVGSFTVIDNKKILFAPILYEGKLYAYNKINGLWIKGNVISGQKLAESSYINYSKNENPNAMKIHARGEIFQGDVTVLSSGVFNLNNKYTVHFSMVNQKHLPNDESKWLLGVELFDKNYDFLGYYQLSTFNNIYWPMQPVVVWKDSMNRFYMLSREGYPVVRIFTLDIKER